MGGKHWKASRYFMQISGAGRMNLKLVPTKGRQAIDFSQRSVGKESTCNAGDIGSIPGSERATGEGIG